MTNILNSHRVNLSGALVSNNGPYLFDLNRTGPGISIPDQMHRGYFAVLEALEAGYIGPDNPLLVIGAGVAGLMAAMTAVDEKVPTLLVEKQRFLATQANCQSRYVCPTQYDWPAAHWTQGRYPYDGEPMMFSWVKGNAASVVRAVVKRDVEKFVAKHKELLKVVFAEFVGYEVTPTKRIKPKLEPEPVDRSDLPEDFAMVFSCAGFGAERTIADPYKNCPVEGDASPSDLPGTPKPYAGLKFWHEDDFEKSQPLLGVKSGKIPRVVISGSGDGALQDFLRIATRHGVLPQGFVSAGALYESIAKSLNDQARQKLEQDLFAIEQEFRKQMADSLSLSPALRTQFKCDISRQVHEDFQLIIEQLAEDGGQWAGITQVLDSSLKNLQSEVNVSLLYPCTHFAPYYGLNRFLVQLIEKYVKARYPGLPVFCPVKLVTRVTSPSSSAGPDHECEAPETCHGKDHEVFWTTAFCNDISPQHIAHEDLFANGPYNVVIVRHGVCPAKDLLKQP